MVTNRNYFLTKKRNPLWLQMIEKMLHEFTIEFFNDVSN
jgi:hypothetical protein